MKDVQGIQRGKCKDTSCECEEYRTSPQAQDLRCEYCNHTPVEHVRIIELGACKICGKDECDKYQSDDPNSYTDCGYCGCGANQHAGAEKLRKQTPRSSSQQGGMAPTQGMPQGGGMSTVFQPRQDAYGQPVQTSDFGTCKCPGCTFPRRREGGKVHDFCSRTCAKKFGDMQSSFYQQKKMVAAHAAQQGGPSQGLVQSQPPHGGGPVSSSSGPPPTNSGGGFFSSLLGSSTTSTPPTGGPTSTPSMPPGSGPAATGGKMCSKCRVRQANPGKGWCQQCFQQSNP